MRNRMLSLLAGALLAAGWMGTAQASVIGDPNAYVSGTFGIGTASPAATLHVYNGAKTGYGTDMYVQTNDPGNGSTRFRIGNSTGATFYLQAMGSSAPGILSKAAAITGAGSAFILGGDVGVPVTLYANNQYGVAGGHLYIAVSGNVGVGTATPSSKLTASTALTGNQKLFKVEGRSNPGNGATYMEVANTATSVTLKAYGTTSGSYASTTALIGKGNALLVGGAAGTPVKLFANNAYAGTGQLTVATSGNVGIGTDAPATLLDVAGEASVNVINIRGGSDFSEQFNIQDGTGKAEPGMVVCIDPEHAGELIVSHKAYDRTVAGIISGAGGVKPGMVMGQQDHALMYGKFPVALTGRVYCMADASNGAIQPGDLLTTSDKPGHAMKVADFDRAHGTIIGKAMTGLDKGQGLVLVLVGLQ